MHSLVVSTDNTEQMSVAPHLATVSQLSVKTPGRAEETAILKRTFLDISELIHENTMRLSVVNKLFY